MFQRPRFKPHLHVAVAPDEGVFVLSGATETLLRGRLYELVAACMDGRPADEICRQLAGQVSPAEVYYTLSQLEKKGCLCETGEGLGELQAAWWSSQQIDPQLAAERLAAARVSVCGIGVDAEPLVGLLASLRVHAAACGKGGEDADLQVVAVDHYLRPELEELNAAALALGRRWLLVKPQGTQLWLGPLFGPGESGCWQCLADRLRANRAVESYLVDRQALAAPGAMDRASTSASLQAAYALAAQAIANWAVRGEAPDYEGNIRTFDLLTWQSQMHHLPKLPYCRACGKRRAVATRPFQPLLLQRGKKSFVRDGGHRVASPEATLERFARHVSPITGAVSMLQRSSPPGDGEMHVYLAGHNLARRSHSLGQLRSDLRNMSAGKGASDVQAKASGLCEGLERHSGVFRGDEPRRTARMYELGEAAVDVRSCLLFSSRQYRDRDAWNAGQSPYNFVPLPFDPEAELEWSLVWSLSRETVRYLPTAFCYYDYPQPKDKRFCIACSNGCAAGNTLEEAILQGFLELVERDSVALWWYNRVRRPGADLDAFDEPYLGRLRESLAAFRREMFVLDLTADLEIPVFAAWSRRIDDPREQIVLGFGAHLDARIALLRAVTEMNQMLSYLLQMPEERLDDERMTDPQTARWLKTATAENQPYLQPDERAPRRTVADFRRAWSDDVLEDVRACQALIERQGLEMLVLDQTRPEIGLPVVKVIVPGLRHFWARFAPGRLYDVPVRLGWLSQSTPEEALNPIPMFL